jgi:hypothetical protein
MRDDLNIPDRVLVAGLGTSGVAAEVESTCVTT